MSQPAFRSLSMGSVPHSDPAAISRRLLETLDISSWPQMPRRGYRESMYVQYSPGLPRIVEDAEHGKVYFDTRGDMSGELAEFYQKYIEDDLEAFALQPDYASGFYAMLEVLQKTPGEWAKGHVTGPISFGLTVTDQDLQPSLYHPELSDAIAKQMGLNARWQVRQMQQLRPKTIIFVDEPYMAQFGSAYISLERGQAIALLDQVFEAIHQEGALVGVHCCANTDWSVLLATQTDYLNLDAYGYTENLALYPAELRAFLDRGGRIAWGLVPNDEDAFKHTGESLAARWRQGIETIIEKAAKRGVTFTLADFTGDGLMCTSCGLGSTTVEIAEASLALLQETTQAINKRTR
jgi:methionine synthase II (cobalamin-independent)